jgi:hypothetical protein
VIDCGRSVQDSASAVAVGAEYGPPRCKVGVITFCDGSGCGGPFVAVGELVAAVRNR